MKRYMFGNLAVVSLIVLAGCATPESRIKDNPGLFASFPPEVQQNVRQGQIDIGYTPEMVEMALGKPDKIETEKAAEGARDIWSYTDTTSTTEQQTYTPSPYVTDKDGDTTYQYRPPVTVNSQKLQEYEKLHVEFMNGKVTKIKTANR
ncbi:MAG: hypothetical protein NT011_04210 [Kiritimatiellaeota bacterium]|nr:hypothetical protein [Kiritimatiellota bacterium]